MVEQHGKTLVPQIRFAGFTDPWEQRKLGEVANVCSGRDYKHLVEGPIPVYGTGGYMTSVSKALSYDEDAIGIGRKGTIDKPYRLQAPFWTVDTLFYAIPEASSDINFLLCSFLNVDWKSKDESTGLPSLSKRAINETEVLVPDNGEQRQIGAFFDRLDSLITLHQRKYDKLCVLKKSMLDKMFPKGGSLYPEIRFAGFTDPWEQRKLGEVASKRIEKNTNEIKETFTNSAEHGIVSQLDYFDHDITNDANIGNYSVVYPDDFVYNPRISTIAPCGPINRNKLGRNGVMSPLYTVFSVDDVINKLYLEYYFKTNSWHQFMFLEGNSGARSDRFSISDSTFFEMPIQCPVLEEQELIASFFNRLDSLITLHQRKLELLRNIKKSMLDKMFV